MKVYLKYIDKLDTSYKKIPIEKIDNNNGITTTNKAMNKEEIVKLLEMNHIELSKHKNIRYYSKKLKGWILLSKDDIIVPQKILVEINQSYNNEKVIPRIEKILGKIENDISKLNELLPYNDSNTSFNGIQSNNVKIIKKNIGIVVLTSSPLIYQPLNKQMNYHNPINYEGCLSNIIDIVKLYNIQCHYDILTKESFKTTIPNLPFIPSIIHIYCHSGYDMTGQFYISFEDKIGNLIKGTAEDFISLRTLLKTDQNNEINEPLYIITTPHSEEASLLLLEADIHNFLCIHSNLINDYQERKFIKLFYEALILKENIQTAMESVSLFMETEYKRNPLYQCCCFHKHEPQCQWKQSYIKDHIQCHNDHMAYSCMCEDKQLNKHKKISCQWAKMFIMKYSIFNPIEKTIKTCCCLNNNISHDKVIHIDHFFMNKSLIPFRDICKRDPNERIVMLNKSCLDLPFALNITTSLIGRNEIMYDIVKIYSESKVNVKQCVILNGDKHTGKRELGKYCGIYLYERGYASDVFIIIIDKSSTVDSISSLLLSKYKEDIGKITAVLLIIIITSNFKDSIEKIIVFLQEQYPLMNYLIINESNEITINTSSMFINHQLTILPLQLNNIITLINELDPSMNILDQSKDRYKKTINNNNQLTDYEIFLQETQGKFNKIFLLSKLFNDKRDEKKKNINDFRKLMQENADIKDLSSIKSHPLKLELLYLLLFHSDGFSLNELDFFYSPAPLETLFNMSPIVIKRPREHGDHFQIQHLSLMVIKKNIIIPSSIKRKVKVMLIQKYSIIYRHFTCASLYTTEICSQNAQLNYGMWNQLSPSFEVNQIALQNVIQRQTSDFLYDFYKKAFNIKTLNILFKHGHDKDINLNELKNLIEDLSITIPSLFYAREQTDALNLIKYNKELLNDWDNFEFAKGRLYLLFAYVYSNFGYSTAENYWLEDGQIKEALRYFNIIQHYEGIAECYFFSSVNKFKCKGFIITEKDHLFDINKALEYFRKDSGNVIGLARVSYQIAYYDLINESIDKNNFDNLLEALEVFNSIKNHNGVLWRLEVLLLISKIYFFMKEYDKAKKYYYDGYEAMKECNKENIKNAYKEHKEKIGDLL